MEEGRRERESLEGETRGRRVVLVNDDPLQLRLLARHLSKAGFCAEVFQSVEAAMKGIKEAPPPDLVVTDLHMPGIDGWKFCRLLRSPEYAALNDVPILVVSATFTGKDAWEITREAGADAFLTAPVEKGRFLEEVRRLLSGSASRRRAVLLVEDAPLQAEQARKAFEKAGYRVETASSGSEGHRKIRSDFFDMAVIDYHLPDMKGDVLLEKFRQARPATVCVMVTADSRPELALKWLKAGASAYLRKPFQADYLVAVCERAWREQSLMHIEDILGERARALRLSRRRYASFFQHVPYGLAITEANGRFVEANENLLAMLGHTLKELQGLTFAQLTPRRWREEEKRRLELFFAGRSAGAFEKELIRKDGSLVPVSIRGWLIKDEGGNVAGIGAFVTDLSAQRAAESALVRKTAEQELLLDTIDTQIWYLVNARTYGAVNEAHARFLGLSKQDLQGKGLRGLPTPEAQRACEENNRRVFETGLANSTEEWLSDRAGRKRLLAVTRTPKLDETGRVEYVVCAGTDITERKELEEELRISEARFRTIFELSPVGIELYDAAGRLLLINQAALDIFGVTDPSTVADFNLFADPSLGAEVRERVLRGETVHYEAPFDFEEVRQSKLYETCRSGTAHMDVLVKPLSVNHGHSCQGYLVLIQDVEWRRRAQEERLELERRLQQTQKSESLGLMAASIAHHFNNLLMAVMGNLELALRGMASGTSVEHNIERAIKAARRAAELSGLMLTYVGRGPKERGPVDLSEVIQKTLPMLAPSIPQGIRVVTDFSPALPVIQGDSSQLRQVAVNLVTNAWESMGEKKGRVDIRTGTKRFGGEAPERDYLLEPLPPGDYVYLEVADTGGGMDRETASKIFDPFFTTRFVGRGLGLAVSLGIVRSHGGAISVKSSPGGGSTFRVLFPVAQSSSGL